MYQSKNIPLCVSVYVYMHLPWGSRVYGICNADVAFSNQIFELEQHQLSGMGGSKMSLFWLEFQAFRLRKPILVPRFSPRLSVEVWGEPGNEARENQSALYSIN